MSDKTGYTFLVSLGETRRRPGGVEATEWLFRQAHFTRDSKVLEVGCNMGTTAIELAKRFGCRVYAVDMDKESLATAQQNIVRRGRSSGICDGGRLLTHDIMYTPSSLDEAE
jgi:cyclopropane fatty-acyl-phospholipid synthase-like methyltransferase